MDSKQITAVIGPFASRHPTGRFLADLRAARRSLFTTFCKDPPWNGAGHEEVIAMARFGLKEQGRLWGLFHGSEMVSETTGIVAGSDRSLSESHDRSQDGDSVEQQPA